MKKSFLIYATFGLFAIGCGVKGNPLPPEKPTELGRGKPTFTRSSEEFRFKNIPPVQTEADEKKVDDKTTDEDKR